MTTNLEALSRSLLLDGWVVIDTPQERESVAPIWGAWRKNAVELSVYEAVRRRRGRPPTHPIVSVGIGCFVEVSLGDRSFVRTYPANSMTVAITALEALEVTQLELQKLVELLPKLAGDLEKRIGLLPDDIDFPRHPRRPGRPKGSKNRPKPAVDPEVGSLTERWFGVIRSGG